MSDSEHTPPPDDTPDWSLIPGKEQEFFGLTEGFVRTDLKRAYNAILRRYKPEKFPAEFQKLRSAYERLEDALRFGTMDRVSPDSRLDLESLQDAPNQESGSTSPELSMPKKASLQTRVIENGAAGLLEELLSQEAMNVQEIVAVGLLRDALAESEPMTLIDSLLQGLHMTEGEPLIAAYLAEAMRAPLPTNDAGKLLLALGELISKTPSLGADWYYYATASQWENLVAKVPFHKFDALLKRCRQYFQGAGFQSYLVLLARLVRKGALRADEKWIRESMTDLEEGYHSLSDGMQSEIEVLDMLLTYKDSREDPSDDPHRTAFDEALLAIMTEDEQEADRKFLEATTLAVDDPEGLLEAFPFETDPSVDSGVPPILGYADDAYQRFKEPEPELGRQTVITQVSRFLFRLEKESDRTWIGRLDNFYHGGGFLVLLAIVIMPVVSALTYLPLQGGIPASIAWLVLMYFGGLKLFRKVLNPLSSIMYRRVWRSKVAEFLEESHMPFNALLHCCIYEEIENANEQYRLAEHLANDTGMLLFSMSLRFAE